MAGGCSDCKDSSNCRSDKAYLKVVVPQKRLENDFLIALAGNPNSGKTTAYNYLTGSTACTGNRPGVTVDVRAKFVKKNILEESKKELRKETGFKLRAENVVIVDIPGTYSLDTYTTDEQIAAKYICEEKPDVIINVIDATNVERGLFLTYQILRTGIPVVIVLNMMDEAKSLGYVIDLEMLSKYFSVPVVSGIAYTGEGFSKALGIAINLAKNSAKDLDKEVCNHSQYSISKDISHTNIYDKISKIVDKAVKKGRTRHWENWIDKIALNEVSGIPLFMLIMMGIFYISFGYVGNYVKDVFGNFLLMVSQFVAQIVIMIKMPIIIEKLFIEGVLGGLTSVFAFIPQILILFLFIAILEDSGYMGRVSFVMDGLMRRFGLGGRSFIPLILGFGCSVPAILATRTIPSKKERLTTAVVVSFVSCGARLPVYSLLAGAFFRESAFLIIALLYFSGIAVALLSALIFNKTLFRGEVSSLVVELPPYRIPKLRNLRIKLWETGRDFVSRLGTIILVASIVIWIAQSMTLTFAYTQNPEISILGIFGKLLAPIFAPIGFGDWQRVSALIAGLAAKETVVSTINIIYGSMQLGVNSFTSASALAFMFFVLLYTPCMASMVALYKEVENVGVFVISFIWQIIVAWSVAFFVYRIALIILAV